MDEAVGGKMALLQRFVGRKCELWPSELGRWLDGKLLAAERGTLSLEFVVREDMVNPMGLLHGGIVAAIADDVIGGTVIASEIWPKFVSLDLATQFVATAKVRDTIVATSNIGNESSRLLTMDCLIRKSDGRMLARATSRVMRL